jgi:hypothetical protein
MITEEEERRISATTTISASAAAFRKCHFPSTEHLRCGALTPPDHRRAQICAAIIPLPPSPFLFPLLPPPHDII